MICLVTQKWETEGQQDFEPSPFYQRIDVFFFFRTETGISPTKGWNLFWKWLACWAKCRKSLLVSDTCAELPANVCLIFMCASLLLFFTSDDKAEWFNRSVDQLSHCFSLWSRFFHRLAEISLCTCLLLTSTSFELMGFAFEIGVTPTMPRVTHFFFRRHVLLVHGSGDFSNDSPREKTQHIRGLTGMIVGRRLQRFIVPAP